MPDNKEKILETARKRFKLAEEAENEIRLLALDDLEFFSGKQWPEEMERQRESEMRPCLTINRLKQFVNQVANDQRQNRPAIQVSPVDDAADVDTAKILQGLIRHIEQDSAADAAYDSAFKSAVIHGFGYFRIITDYCAQDSFDLDIKIRAISNPFMVYIDPSDQTPDRSELNWAFIFENLTKEKYEANYKDSKLSGISDWSSIGDDEPDWINGDSVRIAEYFYKEKKEVKIYKLSDGNVISEDQKELIPPEISIVDERTTTIDNVKWCKTNGIEILEENDWPGKWIPIIPVIGDEIIINGRMILEGIIRHAKDPQRMYNYWATAETEMIALAPKAPYIVAEGQLEGYEDKWNESNTRTQSVLTYKPKTINGETVPGPQRNVYEPPVQAINQARMQSSDEMKATTGIYDAALGNRSNENSGIAIQRRNAQSQTSNFHFIDNLTRAIRLTGQQLLDLIPKIYDTPRTVRIIGENREQDIVAINKIFEKDGEQKQYDFKSGKYDVVVAAGPSYATKRQEAVESMLDMTKAYPQIAQIAGDLMVKNMDWPGAQEISERLRKTLPPGIAEPKDGEKKQIPPEIQQQIQQMQQMTEQLTSALNKANDKLESKEIELESKERIEFAKMHVDLVKTQAQLDAQDNRLAFQAELDQISNRLSLLDMNKPIDEEENEPIQNTNADANTYEETNQAREWQEAMLSQPQEVVQQPMEIQQ